MAESLSVTFMWLDEPFSETLSIFGDTKLETFTILPSLLQLILHVLTSTEANAAYTLPVKLELVFFSLE